MNNLKEFQATGGRFYGIIRNWIQCECINGEHVTWGSTDMLQMKPQSVIEMEWLASEIAFAQYREDKVEPTDLLKKCKKIIEEDREINKDVDLMLLMKRINRYIEE
jgi:hypothetical protein